MDKVVIGIRDYTSHLVPGVVILYCFVFVLEVEFPRADLTFDVAAVLIGGYVAGFLSDVVFTDGALRLVRRIPVYRDPLHFSETNKDTPIEKAARAELSDHLGESLAKDLTTAQACYTYLRYVQIVDQDCFELADRINSLSNLCINLIPPMIFLSISLAYTRNFWFFAICLVCTVMLPIKNRTYRLWFKRTVERQYLLLRMARRTDSIAEASGDKA